MHKCHKKCFHLYHPKPSRVWQTWGGEPLNLEPGQCMCRPCSGILHGVEQTGPCFMHSLPLPRMAQSPSHILPIKWHKVLEGAFQDAKLDRQGLTKCWRGTWTGPLTPPSVRPTPCWPRPNPAPLCLLSRLPSHGVWDRKKGGSHAFRDGTGVSASTGNLDRRGEEADCTVLSTKMQYFVNISPRRKLLGPS